MSTLTYPVIGSVITCTYNGKTYTGKVHPSRMGKAGMLIVLETEKGWRSLKFDEITVIENENLLF